MSGSLRTLAGSQLQPVQGALARQGLAAIRLRAPELPRQVVPVTQQGQQSIPALLVVVVEILIAQAQPQDPLPDQDLDGVFDSIRVSMVGEAVVQPTQNPGRVLHFTQQDTPSVGGELAAVEPADAPPAVQTLKHERCSGTLCGHKIAFLSCYKLLLKKNL